MIEHELAISRIQSFIDRLPEPKSNWFQQEFQKSVLQHWVLGELLLDIYDHPNTSPDNIVQAFVDKMVWFSYLTDTESGKTLYSVASDIAQDILNLLVS